MGSAVSGFRLTWGALPLALISGVIFFADGLQKLLNPFPLTESILGGLPLWGAYLVAAIEGVGGLLLLAGLWVRLAAALQVLVMALTIVEMQRAGGLFGAEGFALPLALLAMAAALCVLGPDPVSLDENLSLPMRMGRTPTLRGEGAIPSTPLVKLASLALMLAAIAVPVYRTAFGIPAGIRPLVITLLVGLVSLLLGASLVVGHAWAYTPAFILARLYLGASALLLFWLNYRLRGAAALAISFLIVTALGSARRPPLP